MQIHTFGTVTLPASVPVWEDSPTADMRTVATLNGHFNPYRGDTAPVKLQRPIVVSALLLAATQAAKGVAIDALRAMLGRRDRLWGTPEDTTQVDRWCYATLRQMIDRGSYKDRRYQQVELIFDAESHWYGAAYGGSTTYNEATLFSNGLYYDAAATAYGNGAALANAGNRLVTDVAITYTSPSAMTGPYGALTFSTQNCEWQLLGTEPQDVWVIDCGARTVTKNGADAYGSFFLTANHASPYWLEVAVGGESLTVAGMDALDYFQVAYSDGWR
jgi:hypothetical protein